MWQFEQLRKFIEEHRHDADLEFRSILLTDPRQELELDNIIVNEIWPGVVKAVSRRPLTTRIGVNETPKQGIRTTGHIYVARELSFILEDPARPNGPATSPPWFCRETIECTSLGYMIRSDFIVSFPSDFSMAKIMRILREPLMQGCPPELSFNESPYGDSSLCLSLTGGSGLSLTDGSDAGRGIRVYDDAREHAYRTTMKNIAIMDSVVDLEADYKNTKLFNNLRRSILDAYEAY